MGRIKKVAGPKHEATMPPVLNAFVSDLKTLPLAQLPSHLASFPTKWPFPRGDLYHWIPALDHFDAVLEQFVQEYGLNKGPQTKRFGTQILQKGLSGPGEAEFHCGSSAKEVQAQGFEEDGDRHLIEAILLFSRMLMDNCGNRSLYNSSERLGDILNTTSPPLLVAALRLAGRLAGRYHYSRARHGVAHHHLHPSLLASHYNINYHHVQKIVDTSVIFAVNPDGSGPAPSTSQEDAANDARVMPEKTVNGNDLFSVTMSGKPANQEDIGGWDHIVFEYYDTGSTSHDSSADAPNGAVGVTNGQPSPGRRGSGQSSRARPAAGGEPQSTSGLSNGLKKDETITSGGRRHLNISRHMLETKSTEELLESLMPSVPEGSHFDLLNKLRFLKALSGSESSRRQLLAARILSLTNLAYIYPETLFEQSVLQQDSDQPRHLQLVEQLRKLIHDPETDMRKVPIEIRTIALGALEVLLKHKSRAADVVSALGINVSHGTLLHILRQAVADLDSDDPTNDLPEADEWREALFSLLESLPSPNSRTADTLVAAGLFEILVDAIKLRTERAQRVLHKILIFLYSITHCVRDAYQTFANNNGLEAIANLVLWEVNTSLDLIKSGESVSSQYRSQVMDYEIPYFQQQTIRWLLKFIHQMMQQNNANVDRLLRNLIDSPPLLTGLRLVISNGKVFGSSVWSFAINIMSSFIHNEPTSYAVVAEAGLSKALLEAISGQSVDSNTPLAQSHHDLIPVIVRSEQPTVVNVEARENVRSKPEIIDKVDLSRTFGETLAEGILPASESILNIPQAFGAICLNPAGLELFLNSRALEVFLEVFESFQHGKALVDSPDYPRMLGSSFDELVRHHPRLKPAIVKAVVIMIARVVQFCKWRATENGEGAKLTTTTNEEDHQPREEPSRGEQQTNGTTARPGASGQQDVEMAEARSSQPSTVYQDDMPVSDYVSIVSGFLIGFCENQSLCLSLIQAGGLDFLLDLATLPSLPYDFHSTEGADFLSKILHMLADYKPHLVLPALLVRINAALEDLRPLFEHQAETPFFSEYVKAKDAKGKAAQAQSSKDGSEIFAAMVKIETLINILAETLSHSLYHSRSSQALFHQVNLTDVYVQLVDDLGKLHRACVWEEVMLQLSLPDSLKESTKANDASGGTGLRETAVNGQPTTAEGSASQAATATNGSTAMETSAAPSHLGSAPNGVSPRPQSDDFEQYPNVKPLRLVLSRIPRQVTSFFSSLGRALLGKRRNDSYHREAAFKMADSIASALIKHLQYEPARDCKEAKDRFAYFIVILTTLSHILVDGSPERSPPMCCTIALNAFKEQDGIELLNGLLQSFFDIVQNKSDQELGLYTCAEGGMKILLTMYSDIVQAKTIMESTSTQAMGGLERDHSSRYYFSPPQFLVELRASVLSAVRPMWGSKLAESSSSSIIKCLLDILRIILEGEQENGAFKRGDNVPARRPATRAKLSIDDPHMDRLLAGSRPKDLAYEALFRTFRSREAAEEYCDTYLLSVGQPRLPVPADEQQKPEEKRARASGTATPSTPRPPAPELWDETQVEGGPAEHALVSEEHSDSEGSDASEDHDEQDDSQHEQTAAASEDRERSATEPNSVASADTDGDGMAMSIDNLLNLSDQAVLTPPAQPQPPAEGSAASAPQPPTEPAAPAADVDPPKTVSVTTVEDLQEARDELRKSLIDNVLEILSVHEEITFDLADLIVTAASKATDGSTMRKEIGETLVQSLISFQMEDDFRPMGKKIASYANLLAILINKKDFWDATLEQLKENFPQLLGFIKIFPEPSAEEPSPWVCQVLLILEKLLSEDCQPHQIRWAAPGHDLDMPAEDPLAAHEPLVPLDEKKQLFEAIIDILPRIGKDQTLALSVVRILVILTRTREIAHALGEKKPLQRLFVMVKQLAWASDERVQKAFMIVLRHIIEDDDTLRGIMSKEIEAFFMNNRGRSQDTTSYIRGTAHLILRSPGIFLEVTNEKLKLQHFDHSSRPQHLTLKTPAAEVTKPDQEENPPDKAAGGSTQLAEGSSADKKPSTTVAGNADTTEDQLKATDIKTPVLENPDGVVHFLLSQLLSYKDIEDKDGQTPKPAPADAPSASSSAATQTEQPQEARPDASSAESKKSDKAEYHAEQHPIYNYRCFLLQCLTELLMSYNRAKIEFINFSRKADPKATTSSKPRSGVLNYLLTSLVPLTSLERVESIAYRKKFGLSQWAMCAIVGLCLKPLSSSLMKEGDVDEEGDSDLLFVRKFVLENGLKAFKDAHAASEPLEQKYTRLMSLTDLFYRLLLGRVFPNISAYAAQQGSNTHRGIAKVMFEKSFISALTNCIADIDLNFPNAKRVVKYILRPLKILTDTGVYLSQNSDLSPVPGQTEDDEISTASSVSDVNDDREETPDLFRNSTLGILEPGREEDMSSEGSDEDEDMLDEEYDDGPEYDEGMEQDDDEVVSEEEMGEEGPIEGLPDDMNMDVEVVIDGDEDDDVDDEPSSDSDDDMDDGDDMGDMEEITGDDENDSLNDGEPGEWQDEDDEDAGEDDEVEVFEPNENDEDDLVDPHGDPAPNSSAVQDLVRDLERDVFMPGIPDLGMNMDNSGRYMVGDLVPADMDMENDEDEDDDDDDEEGMDEPGPYEPDYEDDEDEPHDWSGWGNFPDSDEIPIPRHHPQQSHVRHLARSPWSLFAPDDRGTIGTVDPFTDPPVLSSRTVRERYRSHRPPMPRGNDDGVNPLLQRGDTSTSPRRTGHASSLPPGITDWVHMLHTNHRGDHSAVSFINNIMSAITRGGLDHHTGTLRVRVDNDGPNGPYLTFDENMDAVFSRRHHPTPPHHSHDPARLGREDSSLVPLFHPSQTAKRWQEEAQLLFASHIPEKSNRILNSILALLVPLAMEEEKKRREQEAAAEEARKKQEEEERAREAERLAKEQQEKEEQERKEKEEREAAEAQNAEQQAEAEPVRTEGEPMEGVEATQEAKAEASAGPQSEETTEAGPSNAEAGTSAPQERVRATIRGREVDITGMGIDIEYLNELPEEFREEVLMQQVAEQRSQAVNNGERPTEITREFLDALPPDIRDEIMQQEAQDRRRREREEARRQAAASGDASGAPARAEDMDPASFLASLDPVLRNAVLLDQDDDMLAQLPASIAAEARALTAERPTHPRWPNDIARVHRSNAQRISRGMAPIPSPPKKPRRQVVQMVDKAGVATLLRLLFIQQNSAREIYNKILENISQNRQNRAEIMTLLLSILQEGTADVNAVERSFVQLTSRAKQPAAPKTPSTPKRGMSGSTSSPLTSEMTPLMVIQQCLTVLVFLTSHNPNIPSYFLTEHELSTTLRNKSTKKGKAKESRAAKFPINSLLSLLDRKMIMESAGCMEQLCTLLRTISYPLTILRKKDKEKPQEASREEPKPPATEEAEAAQPSIEGEAQNDGATNVGAATSPAAGAEATDQTTETAQATAEATGVEGEKKEGEKKDEAKKEDGKKQRTLVPPVIPENHLRLVVAILAARECNSKTFRDTLSTIDNFSSIAGTKPIFGEELIKQAQALGDKISNDLDELIPQLQKAGSNSEAQSAPLAKFQPSSSDQAKLLRVLTALDYLFDPERNASKSTGEDSTTDELSKDFLTRLYENATFGPLWGKLSECLSSMRQDDQTSTLNVATILQPLVEALMVVCKNTTLKDTMPSREAKEFAVSSPQPESGMENLFFRFTEDHRKVLNNLVRHNPRLMNGTFSLLVKNPKVLDFDNKRNYFSRRLHTRSEQKPPQPPLQISVRRDQAFMDSYSKLSYRSPDEIKFGKLSVRFSGEEGVDAGGVTREWFQVMSRQMFNPDYALFVPVASDRTTFHPNKLSEINPEHLAFFKFIGRIIGKALYENRALDAHFSRALYKRILGKTVSVKDMETVDLDYHRSLVWMLENDISDIITETFSIEVEKFGVTEIIDLIENGRNVAVTEDNKLEYVQLVVEHRLTGSVKDQLEHFLIGFHDIVPAELISIFNEQELELLISGLPDIDVDDWKNHTEYHNYQAASPQIQWFWRAVRSFDKEERAKLLQFITGTAKVPLNGFKELEGMNGFSRFNIHRDYGNKDRLPSSHTCFNQLDLPEYVDYETLRKQVYTAMTAGSEYFGFA